MSSLLPPLSSFSIHDPPQTPLISMRLGGQQTGELHSALDLLSARMTLGALRVFLLTATLATITAATERDLRQNSSWILEPDTSRSQAGDHINVPWTTERFPHQGLLSAISSLSLGEEKKTVVPPNKKAKSKFTLDNNTGLRKSNAAPGNRLPNNALPGHSTGNEYDNQHKSFQNGNLHNSATMSILHNGRSPSTEGHSRFNELLDHESNRPMRFSLHKVMGPSHNASRAAWMTNRQPSSRLYQFEAFRKEFDSKERDCVHECHKERDEKEAYCNSDFAVNGVIHDVDTVSKGMQVLTVLVDSAGLYKMNRLYITPDGFFFRVKVLAVDNSHCPRSCLNFKLGGRYILMGQIYHKRMELPPFIQRAISGRLRPGDGLVTSSSSFVRRFNRKKDRRVLAAAHAKCK